MGSQQYLKKDYMAKYTTPKAPKKKGNPHPKKDTKSKGGQSGVKISPSKAKTILKEDKAQGKSLTKKQKGLSGAVAGRAKKKK